MRTRATCFIFLLLCLPLPAAAQSRIVWLDLPANNATVGMVFPLDGWALDQSSTSGTGVGGIQAYAFPTDGSAPRFVGSPQYGRPRPDVAAVYGSRFLNSGFHLEASLPPGSYSLVIYAIAAPQRIIFETRAVITVNWTENVTVSVLHAFADGLDGSLPRDTLLQTSNGDFYGTTMGGGQFGRGTVFRLRNGVVTILHQFDGTNGAYPLGSLVEDQNGDLFGTTYRGGTADRGTIFRITKAGVLTRLYSFTGGADGWSPRAGLILASDGNFYGTASEGSACGFQCGAIFRMTPAGAVTPLHTISGTDGNSPSGRLTEGRDGNFYGTTASGEGTGFSGTVFRITTTGVYTVLHRFGAGEGGIPVSHLIQADDGDFYGTTRQGGAYNYGTIFRMTAAGTVTVLHSFSDGDGKYPDGGLVQGPDGSFYGATSDGGPYATGFTKNGVLFRLTRAGTYTVLHAFDDTGGRTPSHGVIRGADGNLYGTTVYGGSALGGVIYRLDPSRPIMFIDDPAPGLSLQQPFRLRGWAADLNAASGPGVDTLHVWAFNTSTGTPTFVGVASYGGARTDVGAVFGSAFTNSGYDLDVSNLTPGQTYDIGVYAHSTVTGTFNQVKFVRVTIQ